MLGLLLVCISISSRPTASSKSVTIGKAERTAVSIFITLSARGI